MYIKNAEKFLLKLNFIGDRTKCSPEEQTCEYYRKINENSQLFAVTTSDNDIMFISEHKILEPNNKMFEDNYENTIILSEFYEIKDLSYVLYKHDLISKTYYDLFNILQKLYDKYRETKNEEFLYMADWGEETIFYMNEIHENTVWADEKEIQEFIKLITEDYVK